MTPGGCGRSCGPTYYHVDATTYPPHAGWQVAVATPHPRLFRLRVWLIRHFRR